MMVRRWRPPWTNHDQHDAANRWFRRNQKHGWATPTTQATFARVSSNSRVFPVAPTPGKAAEILERNLAHADRDEPCTVSS
jgi:hypothetical protein